VDENNEVVEFSEGVLQFLDALAEDLFNEDLKKFYEGNQECQKQPESKN